MAKTTKKTATASDNLERIKKLAVVAMFSDDELLAELVLKGGNAMALVHRLSARASVDLDFSMRHDFPEGPDKMADRIGRALQRTFQPEGYEVIDIKVAEKPAQLSKDMAGFWGGYAVEFKLVEAVVYAQHKGDLEKLRRAAVSLGQSTKFLIDISRFEYTDDKQEADLDGYRIYVYSPTMIVCEKLRAICQQLPEYVPIVKRSGRPGSPRARDFIDIHTLVETLKLDIRTDKALDMLLKMFELKHVPFEWLGKIAESREFHRQDFPAVQATVSTDIELMPFDVYFNYVAQLAASVLAAQKARA